MCARVSGLWLMPQSIRKKELIARIYILVGKICPLKNLSCLYKALAFGNRNQFWSAVQDKYISLFLDKGTCFFQNCPCVSSFSLWTGQAYMYVWTGLYYHRSHPWFSTMANILTCTHCGVFNPLRMGRIWYALCLVETWWTFKSRIHTQWSIRGIYIYIYTKLKSFAVSTPFFMFLSAKSKDKFCTAVWRAMGRLGRPPYYIIPIPYTFIY